MPCDEGNKNFFYGHNCNGGDEPCMLCGQIVCSYHACSNSDGVKGGHSGCSGQCNISGVFAHMCQGHMKRCPGCELTYCSYHRQQAGRGRLMGGHECEVHCKTSHLYRQNCDGEVRKCDHCPYTYCEYHYSPVSTDTDLRSGHVCEGVTQTSGMSQVGQVLEQFVGLSFAEPSITTDRAHSMFPGRVQRGGLNICLVSFPGKFTELWDKLVRSNVSSACVFLPQDDPRGRFGQHASNPATGSCWCHDLYGRPEPWGCLWFEAWKSNLEDAVRLQLSLKVVFFPGQTNQGLCDWSELPAKHRDGVGLGGSQKGEVAYLIREGIGYEGVDIEDVKRILC